MWREKFSNSITDALAYYNKSIDLRILVYIVSRRQKVSDDFLGEISTKSPKAKISFKCPFHDEKNPSFSVNSKRFNCFGKCNLISCDYADFIEKYLLLKRGIKECSLKDILDFLDLVISFDDRFLLQHQYPVLKENNGDYSSDEYVQLFRTYSDCYTSYLRKISTGSYIDYSISKFLITRGFSAGFLHEHGVGYCPKMHDISRERQCYAKFLDLSNRLSLRNSYGRDSMFERLIFPVCDFSGNILGFVGRDCRIHFNNHKFRIPRYKNTTPPPCNKLLFHSALLFLKESLSLLKSNGLDYICITEGPLDCLRLILNGHPAVSILGSNVTEERIKVLSTLPVKRFICCFDNDPAGERAMESFISYAPTLSRSIQRLEIDGRCKDVDEHLKLFPNSFVVSGLIK